MQSNQFYQRHSAFRSAASEVNSDRVRQQTIEQRTPSRDVPRNVMEALVAEEIEVQMQQLPEREQQVLQRSQIMGYALNRLPGLYVTSEKGWERQWSQGKNKYQCQIKIAVRQGIAAVLRDPLRSVTVLSSHPPDIAEAALAQLRLLLMRQELSWHNVVATVQMLLVKGEMEFPDARRSRRRSQESPFQVSSQAIQDESSVPMLSCETAQAWESDRETEAVLSDFFDWDSHPLHQRGY